MMTPADLAGRLHLDRQPRSWRGTCPACGYPRAFSLKPTRTDRALVFCANGCNREELQAEIARVTGETWRLPEPVSQQSEAEARERRKTAALRLWAGSEPAWQTLAMAYLMHRGLPPELAHSPALRFRLDCRHPEGGTWPAMVALVMDVAGKPLAVHRTYLRHDGTGKAPVDPPKASLGPVWGGAIRLADLMPGKPLVIGEGIETAASAGRLMGLPAWAALSAGNMANGLVLPPEAAHVIVAEDPDEPGRQAASAAARRWKAEGRKVQIARPNGNLDFNDISRSAANG